MRATHASEYGSMSWDNYLAYTQAWCLSECSQSIPELVSVDALMANDAVRAGIVFG